VCLHHEDDDGGSTHLRNIGLVPRDYTALHRRKLHLQTLRRENLISHNYRRVKIFMKIVIDHYVSV
jgi:hypothetical protein